MTYLDTGLSVVDDDSVRQVGGHDEVVLHDEGRLLGVQDEPLDQLRARNALEGTGAFGNRRGKRREEEEGRSRDKRQMKQRERESQDVEKECPMKYTNREARNQLNQYSTMSHRGGESRKAKSNNVCTLPLKNANF